MMALKRTPLSRGTARLKRTRLRPRSRTKKAHRHIEPAYLEFLRALPCRVAVRVGSWRLCEGRTDAAHLGGRAFGKKCGDDQAAALCRKHHREQHDATGWWPSNRDARQLIYEDMVSECRSLWLAQEGAL